MLLSSSGSDLRLRGNLNKLYAYSFLKMTLFPMAVITLFWKDHIGLSLTQILLIQSILSFVMVLFEYPAGYVSDRLGYRAALNIASLLGLAGWGLYTVAHHFGDVLAAEILLGISLSFISGADSALLFETLRDAGKETFYARHEGRMNGFAQLGEACGALFAGALYAVAPLLPFFLQIGVWFLALLIARSLVEPVRSIAPRVSHLSEALRTARYVFWDNPRLRSTMLLNAALGISSFYPVWLIQPYLQHSKVPIAWFGPIWTGANLTVAASAVLSHRMQQRLGERRMVLFFLVLVWIGYLGLGWCGGIGAFLFYYLLTTMRGLRGPMMLDLTQRESPSANRAGILSLQTLCFRLLFTCTGPVIGILSDRGGVRGALQYLCFAFVVVLPPLAFLFLRNLHGPECQAAPD
ncbi:MFS transporter [Geomesophilobacter sediminis]|uniref:MFS transporter n=1 Tax=Geomesophilobacter sediminis TaxID=2798584 RepID=A0A8J7J3X0_9BACT|nr:MFS transporter [Geomesophilobacter sediminis]MBJ6725413.1 MFS transporter [Geomesophilobacter sediminis]